MQTETHLATQLYGQTEVIDPRTLPTIGDVIDQWSLATLMWLFKSKQDKSIKTIRAHWDIWLDFFCPNAEDRPGLDALDRTLQQAQDGGDGSASMLALGSVIRSVITQAVLVHESDRAANRAYGIKPPWKIDTTDILRWQMQMENIEITKIKIVRDKRKSKNNPKGGIQRVATTEKLTRETVAQRVALLSSFFIYVSKTHNIMHADGRERPLYDHNPVAAVPRYKIDPYDKAFALTLEQVRALLGTIQRNKTLDGLRDFALFAMYLMTGRRNSEVREMAWGDISADGSEYQVATKGHKYHKTKARLIPPLRAAIMKYLAAAQRLDIIQPADYIFIVHSDRSKRLNNPGDQKRPGEMPISSHEVGRLLKKYARLAGIDETNIHVHVLRHTATELYGDAGDDLEMLSKMLGHSNINTTRIYRDSKKIQTYASWKVVNAQIGLFDEPEPATTNAA